LTLTLTLFPSTPLFRSAAMTVTPSARTRASVSVG
jgi:hypothetical protein